MTQDVFLFIVITLVLSIFLKTRVNTKEQKPVDIRHHFLRDNVEKGLISMKFCSTENQIADIFTKALNRDLFERNRLELGLIKIAYFLINPQ